jgi:hypothetical protein
VGRSCQAQLRALHWLALMTLRLAKMLCFVEFHAGSPSGTSDLDVQFCESISRRCRDVQRLPVSSNDAAGWSNQLAKPAA